MYANTLMITPPNSIIYTLNNIPKSAVRASPVYYKAVDRIFHYALPKPPTSTLAMQLDTVITKVYNSLPPVLILVVEHMAAQNKATI